MPSPQHITRAGQVNLDAVQADAAGVLAPAQVARLRAAGHELGNHMPEEAEYDALDEQRFEAELLRAERAIAALLRSADDDAAPAGGRPQPSGARRKKRANAKSANAKSANAKADARAASPSPPARAPWFRRSSSAAA